MNYFLTILLALALGTQAYKAETAPATTPEEQTDDDEPQQSDGILRILAIGNSFSQDAVEQYLWELADEAGVRMIIGNAYRGGQGFRRRMVIGDDDRHAQRFCRFVHAFHKRRFASGHMFGNGGGGVVAGGQEKAIEQRFQRQFFPALQVHGGPLHAHRSGRDLHDFLQLRPLQGHKGGHDLCGACDKALLVGVFLP